MLGTMPGSDATYAPNHPVRMLAKHLAQAQVRIRASQVRRQACEAGGHLVLANDGPGLYWLEQGPLDIDQLGRWRRNEALLLPSEHEVVVRNASRRRARVACAPFRITIGELTDPLGMLELPANCGPQEQASQELWLALLTSAEATHAGNQWARPRTRGLLIALLSQVIEQALASGRLQFHSERRYPLWLNRVLALVDQRLADPDLDVAAMAQAARLSPSRFRGRFAALLDVPPKRFVLHRRIEAAQALLRQQPQRSVADIAENCGFRDPFHFSVQFKKLTGTTPSAWRTGGS